MSEQNPYQPPQAFVADPAQLNTIDIETLPVSDTWKKRFRWIQASGGPSLKNAKNVPKEQRLTFGLFNFLAFLFGPIYYLAKGMWKRALMYSLIIYSLLIVIVYVLIGSGYEQYANAPGYGAAAFFAMRANLDYYKKMVLNDNGWF
jgi:hypothetical protein